MCRATPLSLAEPTVATDQLAGGGLTLVPSPPTVWRWAPHHQLRDSLSPPRMVALATIGHPHKVLARLRHHPTGGFCGHPDPRSGRPTRGGFDPSLVVSSGRERRIRIFRAKQMAVSPPPPPPLSVQPSPSLSPSPPAANRGRSPLAASPPPHLSPPPLPPPPPPLVPPEHGRCGRKRRQGGWTGGEGWRGARCHWSHGG